MTGEMVVIVNRTSKPLQVLMNGIVRMLKPGENPITSDWIRFAKLQNPRMGTFDQGGLEGEYLVGVKGVDDCSMLQPGTEALANERFDRSKMLDEGKEAVEVTTGVRAPMRRIPSEMSPIPEGTVFLGDK